MDFNRKIFWCIFVFLIIMVIPTTSASKTMFIEIIPSSVISGENFTIGVFDPNITNETPYLIDVFIVFNNKRYEITSESDTGEITIKSPYVLINTTYNLSAYKVGYNVANATLTVVTEGPTPSYELCITPLTDPIQAYKQFTILLTDSYGIPIEGATVYIKESDLGKSSSVTNKNGQVTLTAPNYEEITIISEKPGYMQKKFSLYVITQSSAIDLLLHNPNFPIAISIVILIAVVIYVTQKNRLHPEKSFLFPQDRTKNHIPQTPQITPIVLSDETSKVAGIAASHTSAQKDSKIEEIHIPPNHTINDIISLQIPMQNPLQSSTHSHRWFEQSSDIDSKIDNLLDGTTEKNIEKWFIGTEDLRKKIDATIKDKDTKVIKKYQTKK